MATIPQPAETVPASSGVTAVLATGAGGELASRDVRLQSLTGLRFVAALMVLLYHAPQTFGGIPGIQPLVAAGHVGVSFFFILSGFVLTWSWRETTRTRAFYWRRVARVYPSHVLTWALAIGVLLVEGNSLHPKVMAASLLLVQAWIGPVAYAMNGVAWSLSCEAFFYAVSPGLIPWVRRRTVRQALRGAVAAVVGMALVACVVEYPTGLAATDPLWVFPAFRLGEFVVGVMIATAVQQGWRPRATRGRALVVTGGALVLVAAGHALALAVHGTFSAASHVGTLTMVPFFALLIASAAADERAGDGGFLSRPALVRLGEWSFGLYLVHQLLLRLITALVPGLDHAGTAVLLLGLGGFLVVSFGAAAALYHWVEKPAEARLRRLPLGR